MKGKNKFKHLNKIKNIFNIQNSMECAIVVPSAFFNIRNLLFFYKDLLQILFKHNLVNIIL